jgi:hypothetical protein
MRKLSILTILILIASPLAITQANAAAPKLGGACSKIGIFGDTPKARFICVKSGKKLVWGAWKPPTPNNNSSKNNTNGNSTTGDSSQKPVEPTSQSGTSVSFKAPIPINLPIEKSSEPNAITFANILNRISDIPATTFSKEEALISASTLQVIPHDIFIAPALQSTVTVKSVSDMVDRSIKYYAGFQQGTYFAVYVYNYASLAWAKKQYDSVATTRKYSAVKYYHDRGAKDIESACNGGDCNGNNAGMISGTNEGYLNITVDNGNHPFIESGSIAHEYGHIVQFTQWDGTKYDNLNELKNKTYPGWLFMGGINQPAWTICTGTLEGYMQSRSQQGFNLRRSGLKNLTAQGITNYLLYSSTTESIDVNGKKISESVLPPNPIFEIGNSTGGLATEVLVAIGGPQAVMALHALMASGDSMDVAFMKVYSTPWPEAAKIIGQVIAAEYAQTPPTP